MPYMPYMPYMTLRPSLLRLGHSNFLTSLVQLPDGRLVTGSGDNSLRVWDLHLGGQSCSAVLAGHTAPVRCIVLLESGEALATGADDNSVKIWCAGPTLTLTLT